MAITTKGPKNKKLRRPAMKKSVAEQAHTIAELRRQVAALLQREKATDKELQGYKRQLTEALERQTATSEILGVIASLPMDIQPVLDTVAENAARLCDATDAQIIRLRVTSFVQWLRMGQCQPVIGRISNPFPVPW